MTDYTIFYKSVLSLDDEWSGDNQWDLFISAFNSSERVSAVFQKVVACEKHWLIHPDYNYDPTEYPQGRCFAPKEWREDEFVRAYLGESGMSFGGERVCVDITGFIKPYMMFLLRMLQELGLRRVDVLYSEPRHYAQQEETQFSDEAVVEVRQVAGFEGIGNPDAANDILIIGAGYDDELIARVAGFKDDARKFQLFGLPSLRADMYQENVLRAHRASESIGGPLEFRHYAPAYDPFVTASVLQEIVDGENARAAVTSLYLCPLATKPQALGFTLYYLLDRLGTAASMIYPFCKYHSRQTSAGVARVWKYTVEFPSGAASAQGAGGIGRPTGPAACP